MAIQTFVFFDLETTGLIQGKVMPRITEISLVAISREFIRSDNKDFIPRPLHKLVLPINPQQVIPPNVERMTKLYNNDVQILQPFDEKVYKTIVSFLELLTPPICFAAHNGDKFDYPVFLKELERIDKTFTNEILCIDTWKMFQDFYKKRNLNPVENLLNDEYNNLFLTLNMDVSEEKPKMIPTTSTAQTMHSCDDVTVIYHKVKKYNSNNVDVHASKNHIQDANLQTPKNQIIKPENVLVQRPFKKGNLKKRLHFDCEGPSCYKLSAIYEYMFGTNFTHNHSAEADCLAMLRCVIKIANFFSIGQAITQLHWFAANKRKNNAD